MKISVAMATYNGAKYVKEQIESILPQLDENDELIISDNGSEDGTVEIIKSYDDPRVKYYLCEEKGVIPNFNNAISKTTGDLVFLCDQDDVWESNKVALMKTKVPLDKPAIGISGATIIDEKGNPKDDNPFKYKKGYLTNLIKNTYVGAFMVLNREFLDIVPSCPQNFPMHDIYYSLICEKMHFDIVYVNEKLVRYRRHSDTVTGHTRNSLLKKLTIRKRIIGGINEAVKTIKKQRKKIYGQ